MLSPDFLTTHPSAFILTRWLFLRLLAAVYFCAFTSLMVQITGLIGENGILPARNLLTSARETFGSKAYVLYPTLFWLNQSDLFLKALCLAGSLLSLLLLFGIQTTLLLLLLWLLYLSLVTVGQNFLSFQWDILLLEAGFLAIFLIPLSFFPPSANQSSSIIIIWLFRWLVFRVMFYSGFVKLASGDPTWRNLTAMKYHYETQPLPNPLAWYIHKQPLFMAKMSTFFALFIELIVPFTIFAPPVFRYSGAALLILLQVLIALTGNYTFFNFLTIFLCLFLLDDRLLYTFFPHQLSKGFIPSGFVIVSPVNRYVDWIIASAIIFISLVQFFSLVTGTQQFSKIISPLLAAVQPIHSVNIYGLFAVMTTSRPEIIVEGSIDGRSWLAYEFKYKPGDVRRRLPVVAPHQPRLDWQMWFAALGWPNIPYWFLSFILRLLDGQPEVLKLLAKNPFPSCPPRYIRALLYDYHFSDMKTHARTGVWWRRELIGIYLPPIAVHPQTEIEEEEL
jgi:hypothetical protein